MYECDREQTLTWLAECSGDASDMLSKDTVTMAKGSLREPVRAAPAASPNNVAHRPPSGARSIKKGAKPSVNPIDARNKAVYNAMESLLEQGSHSNAAMLKSIACLSGPEFLQVLAAAVLSLPKHVMQYSCLQSTLHL